MRVPLPEALLNPVSEREIVARFRTTAIAALAGSALLLTATAAYAHDLNRAAGSTTSSMSWAYYSGKLTDIWPGADVYEGASATAMMVSVGDSSYFRVRVSGLHESAAGNSYGAHLHVGPCGIKDPRDAATATVGVHYNTTPLIPGPTPGTTVYTKVSNKTEVWLNFDVNSDRTARDAASVQFVPTPGDKGERSITFHEKTTVHHQIEGGPAAGTAGNKLACLPLKIKNIASGD